MDLNGQTLTLSGPRSFEQEEKNEEAAYTDGIMTIRLPKTEPAAESRIQIK